MIDLPSRAPLTVATPSPADRPIAPAPTIHRFAELMRRNGDAQTPTAPPRALMPTVVALGRGTGGERSALVADAASHAVAQRRDAGQAKARAAGSVAGRGDAPRADAKSETTGHAASGSSEATGGENVDATTSTPFPVGTPAAATPPAPDERIECALLRFRGDASRAVDASTAGTGGNGENGLATSARSATSSGEQAATARRQERGDAAAARIALTAKSAAETPAAAEPFQARLVEATGRAAPRGVESTALGAMVPPAAPATAATAADATSPAAGLTLPTPVDSADFPAAFGLQVRLLAENGVQHAELHLNPAEMGPVSIAIAIEGSQARIEFGADLAATRQAIEAGLPELASALRDAGFTLAGGGVSQHSSPGRGQGHGERRNESARFAVSRAEAARVDEAAQRQLSRARAGGVDLYA